MADNQRLAAILFTDIVGYTALMGSNEEQAMLMLQRNRSIHSSLIKEYNGVYVKEIGDGTLAYFDSAHEAVRCAVAIQTSINKEMNAKLRIGIHLGEIIFENNDVYGDGVNIASRVEPLADPGGICVTDTVDKALRSYPDINTVYLGKAKLKNVSYPMPLYAISSHGLPVPSKKSFAEKSRRTKAVALKPLNIFFYIAIPAIIVLLLFIRYNKKYEVANAQTDLLNIEKIVDSSWRDYSLAYHLAKNIQKIIPDNPKLNSLLNRSSLKVNITSEPAGAKVYVKEYKHPEEEWTYLGVTPLQKIELPITVLRWKLAKEGYDTVLAVASSFMAERNIPANTNWTKESMLASNHFHRVLDKTGTVPKDMVRVKGGLFSYGNLHDFFIDRYEVRNKDYKKFIDEGGYKNPSFWKNQFIKDDKVLNWAQAMALFVDKTGQPGPAVWEAGTYPEGRDDYPVRGVSWYEAAAYAEFAGKSLPSVDHWGLARGDQTFIIEVPQVGGYALFAPFSNFNQKGPVETGKLPGITSYGAYDMAGNVREWCWNKSPMGRALRGGAWNDNIYSFKQPIQSPAFERSEINGFRCVSYIKADSIPEAAFAPVSNFIPSVPEIPPPISDETFEHFKSFYDYDKTPLNAKVLSRNESARDWILEKIQYDAAYNSEKIISYLFLPKNSKPPYQTAIYLPGVAVFFQPNSNNIENYYEFPVFLDYIVKTGRAVMFPVYTGTFERINNFSGMFAMKPDELRTHQFTEFATCYFKDFERSIDYLETRNDINTDKFAIVAMSHGTIFAPIFSSMDTRIKANILISGGAVSLGKPEVDVLNYLARMKQPTLMINGRYDSVIGEEDIKEAFQHIGAKEKSLRLFDTDHIPPRDGMVRETLTWLNKYLGPVQ
jgi:eukaryotic-like serine/threonine-protein kinase